MPADAEVVGRNDVAIGSDQGALDGILQLPYVAGPGVSEQELASLVAEA